MRYILYAFTFCLSCFFLIHVICESKVAEHHAPADRACYLVQEYDYKDFSLQKLRAICGVADIIQNLPTEKNVAEFHFRSVKGTFFQNPSDKSVLFLPPPEPEFLLGKGCHKKVYRGIWFSQNRVEVVAACIGDKSTLHEVDILKMLSLGNDFFPFRTFFSLSDKKHVLVLRFFNLGGLTSLYKKGFHFDQNEKLCIARDVVHALAAMHDKGVAHRDLHDGNVLVHRSLNGRIHASLVDFGRAKTVYSKSKDRPEGASLRNPPEILYLPFSKIEKRPADMYALGCFLYKLLYEADFATVGLYDIHEFHSMTDEDKMETLAKVQAVYTNVCVEYEAFVAQQSVLSPDMVLKRSILQMLNPDPSKRISCAEIVKAVDDVLAHVS